MVTAEVATAAAQPPQELWVGVLVRAHERTVGGHDVRRDDGVCSEAELAAKEADPPTERVADGSDVGGGAGERRQPVASGRLDNLTPKRPRLDAGDTRVHVDIYAP